jgi:hypothetical protein
MNVFMTISLRSMLCLCAALCLCCGVVSAQQPTQQRFLRFLGQRSVTTGTLLPTVEPFRAGVPTTASLVFAIMDSEGRVLKDDNQSEAFIGIVNILPSYYPRIDAPFRSEKKSRATSGIIEFNNVSVSGNAASALTVLCTSASTISTSIIISLVGGYPDRHSFERLKNGRYAVPGIIENNPNFPGVIPSITLGKPVHFNIPYQGGYNHITLRLLDGYGNIPSFSTTVTLSIQKNGFSHLDSNNRLMANIEWSNNEGIVEFPNFTVLGATAASVFLFAELSPSPSYRAFINTGLFDGDFTIYSATSLVFPQQINTGVASLVSTEIGSQKTIYISPNPASDALHITLALPESAPVVVRIEDMLGRIVLRHEEQSALQGAFATTLDVSHLAQGAYTLHVQSGRERWARRVVILR